MDALEEGIKQKVITEEDVTVEKLQGFLSGYGRSFYKVTDSKGEKIVLKRGGAVIVDSLASKSFEVVPFRREKKTWSVEWR